MFEKFNVSGFYASEQAVLSLYAVGRISGCTVDIGHGKIGNITKSKHHASDLDFNSADSTCVFCLCSDSLKPLTFCFFLFFFCERAVRY
jgi:hypothetical protein